MSEFIDQVRTRYEELLKQRASTKVEIRTLKRLLQNSGEIKKVTKKRKPKAT